MFTIYVYNIISGLKFAQCNDESFKEIYMYIEINIHCLARHLLKYCKIYG